MKMSKKIKVDLTEYVSYNNETNTSRCLAPRCKTVLTGKKKFAIQRHYRVMHNINIEDELAKNVQIVDFDNSNIHNDDVICESNQAGYNETGENDTTVPCMDLLVNMEQEKPYKKFIVADYVDYRPAENICKCLIRNCARAMSGRRTGNIKRHYHRVHKFIIVHYYHNDDSDELEDYYENEEFENSVQETDDFIKCETDQTSFNGENEALIKTETETNANTQSNFAMILEKYVEYDQLTNKSRCLVPGCKCFLEGKQLCNIRRHYILVHNCDIDTKQFELKKLKSSDRRKNASTKRTSIHAAELVIYDEETKTYQCLFINCNRILEKNLSVIKKHYRECHKIIISKDAFDRDNNPLVKKRKYQHTYRMQQQQQQQRHDYYVENEPLTDTTMYDHNDYIIDNFSGEQPHCSTSKNRKFNSPKNIPQQLDVTITKYEFLNLCLGLIIERDLPLSLFDDNDYFKPLLAPYEQLFNCHLNTTVMESIVSKSYDIIVSDLKERFANKVLCVELIVVHYKAAYYVVFNVRFIEEEVIYNKIIGVTPFTKSSDRTQITEYLSKFNIVNDQVYMKSLTATSSQPYDSELNTICYIICDYYCDAIHSPIFEFQEMIDNFILKFNDDIMRWQQIAEFDDKLFMDKMGNFKRFKVFLENCNENKIEKIPELQNPLKFMKTIKICWNFMEKMNGEQYVVGDYYRDWLCCELELKELMKLNNNYAGELYKLMANCKRKLLEREEVLTAIYLDPRFNFLGSQILSDEQKNIAKLSLLRKQEMFGKYLPAFFVDNDNISNSGNETTDDEYALLTQHINDTMPLKDNICLRDKLSNCMSTKREPFNLDILKYWRYNRNDMELNQLSQIAFSFPISQYVLKNIENDLMIPTNDMDKFDKFLIKHNYDILEKNIDFIFESLQ